ncbi:uncharacterized protein LOC106664123 [Cimex lectularius]|uniref:Uncharacterized protein n=1 Tax=Cimex lectularius TaxID=79782 RepID=A0A8I6RGD5_CIMLE|nr:uncharacterized protein LOC106664123 [Cimex lectularius]
MCTRFGNFQTIFTYGIITGSTFLMLALKYGPLEVIFVLVLFGVVLYSIVFFIREERRLQGALNTVFSKLCLFRNECAWRKCCDDDVESENFNCGRRKELLINDCACKEKKPKIKKCAKVLDRKCYSDIDKVLEEREKQCSRSDSVCKKVDSDISVYKAKRTTRELSSLNIECLKYAKYDCCSSCDSTCTFRQKRLEIYKLIQTLIDLDHQCSCPESVEFLKGLKQFVTCDVNNKTPMEWWEEYQTLKIPPSCCNLNWYMTLERAGQYGVVCNMHRNENCPQEEKPVTTKCDNGQPCGEIFDQKSQKVKKSKKGNRRFGNWFKRRKPRKKKSNTT